MINCTDFQNQIDDYCRADLSPEVAADSEAHIVSCSECTRLLDAHNHFLASLKAMPVTGPSAGFAKRVFRIAAESESMTQNVGHRRGFAMGFGSAAAAALVIWLVGANPQLVPGEPDVIETARVEVKAETGIEQTIPEFSIALNQRRDIKLAFFSSEDLNGATITLRMPENVALVGYEGQRELSWKTNLAKGDNTLRLPVVASSVTSGQLVARIEYKGKVKTLRVNLAIGTASGAPGLSGSTGFGLQVG